MRILLALLIATPLFAQVPRYQEELTVAEVTLEMTVTDRDGKPVTGLTANDFELLEDGKPVAITFFREVNAAAPPRAAAGSAPATAEPLSAEPRTLFIFLDNREVGESIRRRMFNSLRTTVTEAMESGAGVFYFVWTGKLQAVKPKDLPRAMELLEQFEKDEAFVRGAKGGNRSRTKSLEFDLELSQAMARTKSLDLLAALDASAKIAMRFPGRRILLFASRGFSIPAPTRQDSKILEDAVGSAFEGHPLATDELEGNLFAPDLLIPTHGAAALGTSIEDAAAAVANRYGIPVYGLFTGGLEAAATRTGIQTGGIPEPFSITAAQAQLPREVGSITDLAFRTGGVALGAGSNFGPFLENVTRDLNHFYTLAYRSSGELRFRKLEVRPKDRALKVRHREAAVPDDDAAMR